MNTKSLTLITLLCLPLLSVAQLQLGLSGGAVLGNFTVFSSVQNDPRGIETSLNSQARTGFSFQIPIQYSFSKYIAIQHELGYQRQVAGIERIYLMN